MKYYLLVLITTLLLGSGCSTVPAPQPLACTEEAKLCPDGSYVARTGPNCEFAACPVATSTNSQPIKYPTFTKLGVSITPLEVLQDSRCAVGVQCVWAGTVELKVSIASIGGVYEQVLKLGEPTIVKNRGRVIELTAVKPDKEINKNISPDEYKFIFSITADATGQHCGGFIRNAPTCPSGFHCKLHLIADTGGECVKDSATPPPVTPPAATSGIEGTVTIGPTCPVQRMPPDPNCADKPYQATINVETVDGQKQITQFTTDANGQFKVILAPGSYLLVPVSNNVYPRESTQTVAVEKNKFTSVVITFDSGIR